jgi:hypothetical protein
MTKNSEMHRERLETLQRMLTAVNEPDMAVGVLLPGAGATELAAFDASMMEKLQCRLPECYRSFLESCDGVGTQGSVLFGTDAITAPQPADWDKTRCHLRDPFRAA